MPIYVLPASGWCCWIIICNKSTIYYFFIFVGVVRRCAAGWLSVRASPCTVRGLFAMRCAARGLVAFARCAVMHGMRGSMRCELFAIQCAARGLVAFARCRRHHAFDGGIFRVLRYGRMGGRIQMHLVLYHQQTTRKKGHHDSWHFLCASLTVYVSSLHL